MVDYWSKLGLNEAWSKKERFNYIMNYVDELASSNNNAPSGNTNGEDGGDVEVNNASVHVSVTDSRNKAIKGASVKLSKDGDVYTGTTGTDGKCIIDDVPLGHYDIVTSKDEYIDDEDDLTLVAGVNNVEITLSYEETCDISVSVVDEEDNPVANADVSVYDKGDPYDGTTGSAGGCTIRNVPYGTYTIEAVAEGFEFTVESITVDASEMSRKLVLIHE